MLATQLKPLKSEKSVSRQTTTRITSLTFLLNELLVNWSWWCRWWLIHRWDARWWLNQSALLVFDQLVWSILRDEQLTGGIRRQTVYCTRVISVCFEVSCVRRRCQLVWSYVVCYRTWRDGRCSCRAQCRWRRVVVDQIIYQSWRDARMHGGWECVS